MTGEISEPVKCDDVTVEGKRMAAVTVRVSEAVRVELRDVRHVSDLFQSYHFVVKLHVGAEPQVRVTDNALLVEVDGYVVHDLEFQDIVDRVERARENDFIVLKLVLFPVYILHVSAPSSLPPVQLQFRVATVPHDSHSFFYAVSQSLQFGHANVAATAWQREVAEGWRHRLWRAWQNYWSRLTPAQRKAALRKFHASYPRVAATVNPSDESFWMEDDVTEFHIRFLSDVAGVKLVIYSFKSRQTWDDVCGMPLVTAADLMEEGHLWRTVVGDQYTTVVYLMNVYDDTSGFQHFASLIPVPYLRASA